MTQRVPYAGRKPCPHRGGFNGGELPFCWLGRRYVSHCEKGL
jgi:hypothetical protein